MELQINTPIALQSETQEAIVRPEDYIIADLNGVVCLSKGLAERAVELIASQAEADDRIAYDLMSGRTVSEASKEHRTSLKMPARTSFIQ